MKHRAVTDPIPIDGARRRRAAGLILACAIVTGIAYAFFRLTPQPPVPGPGLPGTPPPAAATHATNAAAAPRSDFEALQGQWQRPDGGYVLDVKRVDAGGTVTAEYFNPRPIRVARAEAQRSDGASKLFVELRDEGYPGCTYTLTYHPERDELVGVYFQAALGESYNVEFVRLK